MASINAIDGTAASSAVSSGELAKLEGQLADWVHCPSGKTDEGKEKIAEITDKIDVAKGQIKKTDDAKAAEAKQASTPKPTLRFDGLGTMLDAQA